LAPSRPPQTRSGRAAADRKPADTLTLHFKPQSDLARVDDPLRRDISSIAVAGRTLFAACDETATVERLVRAAGGDYHQQESIALGSYFDLPAGPTGEMDIEGLAIADDVLWIVGSHSLKRDKPDLPSDDNAKALDELADIDCDPNRYFLGRLPLVTDRGGVHRVIGPNDQASGKSGPACVKMKPKGRNALTKVLQGDRHLSAAMTMPCKENGFDIEGLAVKDDRVFLGLRGPVLSGWAVIIELRVKVSKPGRIKLRKCAPKGRRYLKHFLPLEGLGIRDLRFDHEDLLVLTGPTMDHDGTGALFRWQSPLRADNDQVHPPNEVERIMDLAYDRGLDQAEAIAFVPQGDDRRLLVVHDNPSAARLPGDEEGLIADLFDLEGSG
jgi:hypothetical protein